MRAALYLGAFVLWNLVASLALVSLGPPLGLAAVLALSAAFLWGFLLAGDPERQAAFLRLAPLDGARMRWILVSVPVFLVFTTALGEVYIHLVPVPPENFDPFARLTTDAQGRLTITLWAIVIAPVLEEFVFRGAVQGALERRAGALAAILLTTLAFAVLHGRLRVLPLYLFLGIAFGFAVYVTGSVWAGVVLHAANNAAAMVGTGLQGESATQLPTLWSTGPTAAWWWALVTTLASGALLAAVVVQLWKARPERGLRHAAADG